MSVSILATTNRGSTRLTGKLDAYLAHRLRLAVCEAPLFEPPAVEALFQATRRRHGPCALVWPYLIRRPCSLRAVDSFEHQSRVEVSMLECGCHSVNIGAGRARLAVGMPPIAGSPRHRPCAEKPVRAKLDEEVLEACRVDDLLGAAIGFGTTLT